MLDARMQEAYLSSFQYDDIDSAALPGEIDCTPRVGDEGALFLDYPDGSGDAEELMFRVGVMDSGLPVIELRTSADDDWDEVRPCFFDEISLRNGMVLTLRSRTPAAHSPGYPYGMTEDDPKLFDLDTEDEQPVAFGALFRLHGDAQGHLAQGRHVHVRRVDEHMHERGAGLRVVACVDGHVEAAHLTRLASVHEPGEPVTQLVWSLAGQERLAPFLEPVHLLVVLAAGTEQHTMQRTAVGGDAFGMVMVAHDAVSCPLPWPASHWVTRVMSTASRSNAIEW